MHVSCAHSVLAVSSTSAIRPPCSGSSTSVSNAAHVLHTSWRSRGRALFPVFLLALAALHTPVSAAPWTLAPSIDGIVKRQGPPGGNSGNDDSSNNGSINMSVWLPILLVTVVFALFSFIMCIRRCTAADAGGATAGNTNRAASGGNTTRPRRRPQRTPSQVSTKSLPAYMKEPGDQELVLFRGPSEAEDDPPPAMPTLTEDDDEHPEMRGTMFDIALDRIESVDTMADASTTNLIRRVSEAVPKPSELDPRARSRDDRRSGDAHSLDSVRSEAGLLDARRRDDSADPRGEAPPYSEAVAAEEGRTFISLNDPEPNSVTANTNVPTTLVPGRGRPRFSFLTQNPFISHFHSNGASSHDNHSTSSIHSESPAQHVRSGSTLSRLSTRESHDSHHSRTPSRNNNLARSRSHSHSRSSSHLLRGFRSHSPGPNAGSSTISLESISAPLTHTATRAEFHAPKGGLMTAEQIKLITSREALEKFGIPYGPDAVAASSQSRERLAAMGPPPDFDSVRDEQAQHGVSGGGASVVETTVARSDDLGADIALPRSTSPLGVSSLHRGDERAESRASSDLSYETAAELEWQAQVVQAYGSGQEGELDEPSTARPTTPSTARPFGLSR